MSEEFLSEEDLDLRNLSERELYAWWDAWLRAAQVTNDQDEHLYSHGVFQEEPAPRPRQGPALVDTSLPEDRARGDRP